ncbi:MAG: hypothetical protein WBQ72_12195 [Terriglobales bacterium]
MATLVCVLGAGMAAAQNPSIIQNTRAVMNGVRDNAAAASNAALGVSQKKSVPAAAPARKSAADPAAGESPMKVKVGHRRPVAVVPMAKQSPTGVLAEAPKKIGPLVAVPAAGAAGDAAAVGEAGESEKFNANGKRDPFLSPVVSHAMVGGSGCSTGKKCLEIGAINLRGVVHAESGFIAVVSNGLNKAYFLRENDPVFNGYVVKITGDSIVFQETLQDRVGKTFTREVVKKITVPSV